MLCYYVPRGTTVVGFELNEPVVLAAGDAVVTGTRLLLHGNHDRSRFSTAFLLAYISDASVHPVDRTTDLFRGLILIAMGATAGVISALWVVWAKPFSAPLLPVALWRWSWLVWATFAVGFLSGGSRIVARQFRDVDRHRLSFHWHGRRVREFVDGGAIEQMDELTRYITTVGAANQGVA